MSASQMIKNKSQFLSVMQMKIIDQCKPMRKGCAQHYNKNWEGQLHWVYSPQIMRQVKALKHWPWLWLWIECPSIHVLKGIIQTCFFPSLQQWIIYFHCFFCWVSIIKIKCLTMVLHIHVAFVEAGVVAVLHYFKVNFNKQVNMPVRKWADVEESSLFCSLNRHVTPLLSGEWQT